MLFITSDWHIGHDRDFIWKARGFSSVADHDAALIGCWRNTVGNWDDVLLLGDFMMGPDKANRMAALLADLPFHLLTFVCGNHDPKADKLRDVFDDAGLTRRIVVWDMNPAVPHQFCIAGQDWAVSHFPRKGSGAPADSAENAQDFDKIAPVTPLPLLHGHTHSASRGGSRDVHVGWDAWGRFVTGADLT